MFRACEMNTVVEWSENVAITITDAVAHRQQIVERLTLKAAIRSRAQLEGFAALLACERPP
jgi:hypothetical protein